jgi:hypothetical protein
MMEEWNGGIMEEIGGQKSEIRGQGKAQKCQNPSSK